MRVLLISANWGGGGPGGVVKDLYYKIINSGYEACVAYARGSIPNDVKSIRIGNQLDVYTHAIKARLFDGAGFGSVCATRKLINDIKAYNPDIVNLHNLNGYTINLEILLNYLKESKIPVVWTLHDCWAFTGHCINFQRVQCVKWKDRCSNCVLTHDYPKSLLFDRSRENFDKKKEILKGFKNLHLVTPSKWLSELVTQSFLKEYPIYVINNGINLDIFKPTASNIRPIYHLDEKIILLAVANHWNEMKGQGYLFSLAKMLDNKYKIVMIGVDSFIKLPKGILGISRTQDVKELVQWYSAADLFINPTMGDNFPTVNIEALACGLPVITFNTGGSSEIAGNVWGKVVPAGNIELLKEAIDECVVNKIDRAQCVQRASEFDREKRFNDYINLFKQLTLKR